MLKTRRTAYTIAVLTGSVLSLVPAILWMDFVAPYSAYDVWQRRENELVFRLSGEAVTTGELEVEIAVFKVLVAPTMIPASIGLPRPEYTRFAFPDGTIVELAGIQPSRLAMDYVALAVPTWTLLIALCYEALRWASRCRRVAA